MVLIDMGNDTFAQRGRIPQVQKTNHVSPFSGSIDHNHPAIAVFELS